VSTIGKALAVVLATGIAMPVGTSLMAEEQLSRLPRIGVLVDQWVKAFEEGLRENSAYCWFALLSKHRVAVGGRLRNHL